MTDLYISNLITHDGRSEYSFQNVILPDTYKFSRLYLAAFLQDSIGNLTEIILNFISYDGNNNSMLIGVANCLSIGQQFKVKISINQ